MIANQPKEGDRRGREQKEDSKRNEEMGKGDSDRGGVKEII